MRRPVSALLLLTALWLGASVARAEPARAGGKRRSPQEEKRRKLLEEIGLDKKDTPPPAASTASPPPSPDSSPGDQKAEAAPATSQEQDRRGSRNTGPSKSTAPAAPSFRRVIHPLLMTTCGSCHRAGGPAAATRFALAGDPATDHAVVARLVAIRDPAASALLLKVSGQPHAGGSPWPTGSDAYARVLAWVGKGARLDGASTVEAPPEPPAAPALPATPSPRKPPPPPAGALVRPPVAPPAPPMVPSAPVEVPPASETASPPPAAAPRNDFASVVHPILMASCASCHASGAPAGMTRLVLSGAAAGDEAVARTLLDPAAPERSLLLSKASGEMHGGGTVLPAGDARQGALLAWATQAASPALVAPVATPLAPASPPPAATSAVAAPPGPRPPGDGHHGGLELPLGFLLNGRFDLNYERRQFTGNPFDSEGVNALRSYHHFLFLSRASSDDPCGLSVEIVTLQFWEAHCRVLGRSYPVSLVVSGGKILVPFGADPLYHQSYGGLAGFDQRILPVIWAQEGIAAHLVHQRADLVVSDDFFAVRGYALGRADAVLNLQNDFSPVDEAKIGWGNRIGAAWRGISGWYSAYFNPLGFGRHLFMQAVDLTIWRQRSLPVVGHFSLGAGLFRADVSGGDDDGVGGVGKDYYHFGSYLQVRYHPTDWLFLQYRQGLRTFNNRRGTILDNSRLTSADSSTHNLGVVGRYRGLTAGVFYFINLEKVDEIPDDLFRVSIAYDF